MALTATFTRNEVEVKFGVGDTVRIVQRIVEGEKERLQAFEGIVIKIRGRGENKSFTVRRIGAQQIGIERIFPLFMPTIEQIEVVRSGGGGVRRSKLYFIRDKSKREIEKIYSRAKKREQNKKDSKSKKKSISKKTSSKRRTTRSKKK
jgi:large subunit ribosomal protein L19